MFKEIYKHLKDGGFEVYSIGQHKGNCEKQYIVISETGSNEIIGKNLMSDNIELLIYYPIGIYSEFTTYINQIKITMKDLKSYRRIISPNPIIVDDDKKAYMTFLSYRKIRIKER